MFRMKHFSVRICETKKELILSLITCNIIVYLVLHGFNTNFVLFILRMETKIVTIFLDIGFFDFGRILTALLDDISHAFPLVSGQATQLDT